VKMVLSYEILTLYEANTCVALPNYCGIRCAHFHSNNGSETTVVEIVEQTRVVYHVAEPRTTLKGTHGLGIGLVALYLSPRSIFRIGVNCIAECNIIVKQFH
jgi:hypothetical protein